MVRETNEGLKIHEGLNGDESLFIDSSRIDDCIDYLYKNNLKDISINPYQGYKANDINFLDKLENYIEEISVLDEKYDYSILNRLHKLKRIGFLDNKRDIIDLSNFPELEGLSCDYSPRLKGLETCKHIKDLTLTGYKPKSKNFSDLPSLPELTELLLIQTNITTLQGIECFSKLKKLELYSARNLETIAALQALPNSFEEIQFEQCRKISDLEILGKIQSLKKIILPEGEIESLAFVEGLPHLEFISFWGTKVLDGNINYCKNIGFVGFDNKKHYTHTFEQFKNREQSPKII